MPQKPKFFTMTIKTKSFLNLFSLRVIHKADHTQLVMKAFTKQVTTKGIPLTYDILKKELPSVLSSRCFNDQKLPFSEEVRATEIGHLFEHVLLQYLCQEKIAYGYTEATYNGLTKWNWLRDPYGTFMITIDSGYEDLAIFPFALQKTILLLQQILQSTTIMFEDLPSVGVQHTPAVVQ